LHRVNLRARRCLTDVPTPSDRPAQAIVLSAIDGRSHEEVADVLGVSHGAVRGLLYRARETLRAAAAAVMPQPLINWAWGSLGGAGAASERLAEISAPAGAAGMTAALLKGAELRAGLADGRRACHRAPIRGRSGQQRRLGGR
jgi:hypothetical protein